MLRRGFPVACAPLENGKVLQCRSKLRIFMQRLLEHFRRTRTVAGSNQSQSFQVQHFHILRISCNESFDSHQCFAPLLLLNQLNRLLILWWITRQNGRRRQQGNSNQRPQQDQNSMRPANCTDLGANVDVAIPKVPLVRSVSNPFKFTRLKTL